MRGPGFDSLGPADFNSRNISQRHALHVERTEISKPRLDWKFPARDTTLVTDVIFQETTANQMMGPRIARESDFGF